jgi:hypothetical protein
MTAQAETLPLTFTPLLTRCAIGPRPAMNIEELLRSSERHKSTQNARNARYRRSLSGQLTLPECLKRRTPQPSGRGSKRTCWLSPPFSAYWVTAEQQHKRSAMEGKCLTTWTMWKCSPLPPSSREAPNTSSTCRRKARACNTSTRRYT